MSNNPRRRFKAKAARAIHRQEEQGTPVPYKAAMVCLPGPAVLQATHSASRPALSRRITGDEVSQSRAVTGLKAASGIKQDNPFHRIVGFMEISISRDFPISWQVKALFPGVDTPVVWLNLLWATARRGVPSGPRRPDNTIRSSAAIAVSSQTRPRRCPGSRLGTKHGGAG